MERDSILFYRSFYEAIKGLHKDIQLEIYTAVMEYGLNGVLPDNLKPVTKGMFALMKPILDNNNVRYENGKKGGRKPTVKTKETATPPYSLTFGQEIDQMKTDKEWAASICDDYSISPDEYSDRLGRFLRHCNDTRRDKPHDSLDDARSHLRYWMDKAYPRQPSHAPSSDAEPTADFANLGSDFGGMDYD